MENFNNQVILRDSMADCWLRFDSPVEVVQTYQVDKVLESLQYVEEAVNGRGLYAAGMIAYEAAPAFDPSLAVRSDEGFPLLWFGLYHQPLRIDLPPAPQSAQPEATWLASVSPEEYQQAFEQIKDHIKNGDIYQVNYSYRLRCSSSAAPMAFLRLLKDQNPPFGATLTADNFSIHSASPELFFRLEGNLIESRPMKGTAARGLTLEEDCREAAALQNSEKNRAENLMIVDMVRNDLGRIAETGSVKVSNLFALEKYPTLWQLTSTVSAQTKASVADIFKAMFPAASITGAPKNRAMQIIAELESTPRRIYTGSIGFIAPGRRAQFNVAIRSLVVSGKDNTIEYGTGGGIVWDSEWESELAECRTKAGILETQTTGFSILETLLWTPEGGYRLLEHHLQRMAASALYFSYPLAAAAIREHLVSLSHRLPPSPHKVRILLAADGQITSQADAIALAADCSPKQVALAPFPVDKSNRFLYHKTTSRQIYQQALAACPGYDDVILYNGDGEVTESSTANVVVDLDGVLCTPPVHCGLLAGTYRAWLLERNQIEERVIRADQLFQGHAVYLINSVRGMYGVRVVKTENTVTEP